MPRCVTDDAGAALDVWWQYPNAAEPERRGSRHPFEKLPNVIMTPHNSGWTDGMTRAAGPRSPITSAASSAARSR